MNAETSPKADEDRGIRCRRCGCGHWYTIYTRKYADKIVRRRQCRHCGHRATTTERLTG